MYAPEKCVKNRYCIKWVLTRLKFKLFSTTALNTKTFLKFEIEFFWSYTVTMDVGVGILRVKKKN